MGLFSYIQRHWRGEFPLVQSYWINGVLVGMPFNLYFNILSAVIAVSPIESPIVAFCLIAIPLAALQPLLVWQGVGIWRSAGHEIEKGKRGWAWVARVVILLNLVFVIYNYAKIGNALYVSVAAAVEEWNAKYDIKTTGASVVFNGDIADSSAEKLEPLLRSKNIRQLVIKSSRGGLISAALRLSKLIRDRQLSVVATEECDSACTVLLAAGSRRAVNALTIVRLHMATQAGTLNEGTAWKEAENYYIADGMTPEMLKEIDLHRGPTDSYEPTIEAMMQNGLITDIFNLRLKKYEPAWQWCGERETYCKRTGAQNQLSHSVADGFSVFHKCETWRQQQQPRYPNRSSASRSSDCDQPALYISTGYISDAMSTCVIVSFVFPFMSSKCSVIVEAGRSGESSSRPFSSEKCASSTSLSPSTISR